MTEPPAGTSHPASPYSTGGGGTVLELRYGALLLCNLLTGDPIPELGDDATIAIVSFQAGAQSPVDDFLITGSGGDGAERRSSVAVRRSPKFTPSETHSVDLIASYLPLVTDHWEEVRSDRWRIALATTQASAVEQVHKLTEIASATPDSSAFRAAVERPSRTTRDVRQRLSHFQKIVSSAMQKTNIGSFESDDIAWRLLSSLRIRKLRLEPPDDSDRALLVASLRSQTTGESPVEADRLFAQIAELAGRYGPVAAEVNEAILRRDLAGSSDLQRSSRYLDAWAKLDSLNQRLRDRIRGSLADSSENVLTLTREAELARLVKFLRSANSLRGDPASTLLITGQPEVGKSALTIRAVDCLQTDTAALHLSLRDLLSSTIETEALLGASLQEVLAGLEVREIRLLVIDGAEAVLEGRHDLFIDLTTAALRVGLAVVAITRDDGEQSVRGALQESALAIQESDTKPIDHRVGGLTQEEVANILSRFPALVSLASDDRAIWMLTRPGLVDLVLRSGSPTLPDRFLSEADIFAAVWSGLVRRKERIPDSGLGPDDRENALLAIARRTLDRDARTDTASAIALASLRSDGLLLSRGPTAAWNPGDEFASDLVRDLAVARLFVTDGYEQLAAAGAPRWAFRAARIACQVAIVRCPDETSANRTAQEREFARLAEHHGARWAEAPLEAILDLPEVLEQAWPSLYAEPERGLLALTELALRQYTTGTIGETIKLAPLVGLLCDHWEELPTHNSWRLEDPIADLLLAWLRGAAFTDCGHNQLRIRLRNILTPGPEICSTEFIVESLAMLGSDLDDDAKSRIRKVSFASPADLCPAVESMVAVYSLAAHHPTFLSFLTDNYYINHETPVYPWEPRIYMIDDGVRGHQPTRNRFPNPLAYWNYGPFYALLSHDPLLGIRTINRILNHAAQVYVDSSTDSSGSRDDDDLAALVLKLDLYGLGTREYVGDGTVWTWYRRSSVGPYPCMSALLAVERFADELIDKGYALQNIAKALLSECDNLAMPGLIVGMLVRHITAVTDELDVWLTRPDIWEFEFARRSHEGVRLVQDINSDGPHERESRLLTLRDVATLLMVDAVAAGDTDRQTALDQCGNELIRRAKSALPESSNDNDLDARVSDALITVQLWAAHLDPSNYTETTLADGEPGIIFRLPTDLANSNETRGINLSRSADASRLLDRYGFRQKIDYDDDTLRSDLASARQLLSDPPDSGSLFPHEAAAAVASEAATAHAAGRFSLTNEELAWIPDLIVECALNAPEIEYRNPYERSPLGTDRAAAIALPSLLLLATRTEFQRPPPKVVRRALIASATSAAQEVRQITALSLRHIWESPCNSGHTGGRCIHNTGLAVVRQMIAKINYRQQQRPYQLYNLKLSLTAKLSVDAAPGDSIILRELTAPTIAAGRAALVSSCVRKKARRLLSSLLEAHLRGANYSKDRIYSYHDRDCFHYAAQIMFEFAAQDDSSLLLDHISGLRQCPNALHQLLHELSALATSDPALRSSLSTVWPLVFDAALSQIGEIDNGADSDTTGVLAHMIPQPLADRTIVDPGTLEEAKNNWIDPAMLTQLIMRWIPLASGRPSCVDSLVCIVKTATPIWQATTGIAWVSRLIGRNYADVARRTFFLPEWLGELCRVGHLNRESHRLVNVLVDGLASHGETRVLNLQRPDQY